jgi:hypothetical protein
VNYFSYFTEIEDEFIRRRGSHLLVSPLDWSLIEAWKQRGIPLHIVLRGIHQSFDAHEKRLTQTRRGRKVNTLFYCRQEVEACYEDYLEAQVGASDGEDETVASLDGEAKVAATGAGEPSLFEWEKVRDYLVAQRLAFEQRSVGGPVEGRVRELLLRTSGRIHSLVEEMQLAKQISYETLEADLTRIESALFAGLREEVEPTTLAEWEREGRSQLKPYRETMKAETYQQTLENYLNGRLRELFRIPRLSLFYMAF